MIRKSQIREMVKAVRLSILEMNDESRYRLPVERDIGGLLKGFVPDELAAERAEAAVQLILGILEGGGS